MKAHVITATINGFPTYLVRDADGNVAMHGGTNEIFNATLFIHRADAENAVDRLTYGVGKGCSICTVEISTPVTANA